MLALRLTDSKVDAEDAVQDVFVKLWHERNRLSSVSNPRAYAVTMTRNRCLDLIDARRAASQIEAVDIPSEEDVEEVLIEALKSLPATQRRVMELRYVDELPMSDIESQTGLSQGNVRVILSRARTVIRKKFSRK